MSATDEQIIAEVCRQRGMSPVLSYEATVAAHALRLVRAGWTPVDPVLVMARESEAALWDARICPREAHAVRAGERDVAAGITSALAMHALLAERGMLK